MCIIVFQLLIFQDELSKSFLKNLEEILALIESIRFRSIIVKSKTRQIKSKSIDSNNINSFVSSDWVIDKSLIRKIIKQFLLNTKTYRLSFQKFRKFEEITSQFSTFSFIENKSQKSSLTFFKHKHNSSNSDIISIVWSKIIDIFQNFDTMSFKQSSNNILANLDLISKQMQTLSDTILITVNIKINRLSNDLRQLLQSAVFSQQSSVIIEQRIDVGERSTKDWTAKKVEFFDSIADELKSIINLDKHIFYNNIYVFVDRLKDVAIIRKKNKLKNVISQYLRDIALIWHFTKLFNIEKEIYREMSLINWYNFLIKRFKKRTSAALINVQSIKYTLNDAREQRNFKIFAQNFFRQTKAAEITFIYNQLCMIWNNLNWKFRLHILQLKETITIQFFLKQVDDQIDIWHEMFSIKQNYSQFRRNLNSKQYYSSQKRSQNSQFYRNKNHAYQARSQMSRNDRSLRVKIITKMKNSRESSSEQNFSRSKNTNEKYEKKKNERSFENDRQKRDENDRQERDENDKQKRDKDDRQKRYDKKNKYDDRFKVKICLIYDDQDTNNDTIIDDCENYHQSQNLEYFDFDYDFEEFSDFKITILTTTTTEFSCRRCERIFFFNNQFHKHIRVAKCIKVQTRNKTIKWKNEAYLNNIFAINDDFISLISFKIHSNKNIEIKYDFKDWKYVTVNVSLFLNSKSDLSCIDFETNITFIDVEFFQEKVKNVLIRIMIISIAVRELDITKHTTNKYVILSMYFSDTKNDTFANAVIIREVHLIKGLKANLLIENTVLDSKMIDISNFTESIYIDNRDVTILIVIKIDIKSQFRSVHALKAFMISSKSKCLILMYNIVSLSDRDFLFESKKTINLFIYAHILDFETSFILVRNDQNHVMKISRNFRLNTITELDYFNAY